MLSVTLFSRRSLVDVVLSQLAPSILLLAIQPTSNSRLTPLILLISWPKNAKNANNTNVGPVKETIPLTRKKAPVGQTVCNAPRISKEAPPFARQGTHGYSMVGQNPPFLCNGGFPCVIFQKKNAKNQKNKWKIGGLPPSHFFVHRGG